MCSGKQKKCKDRKGTLSDKVIENILPLWKFLNMRYLASTPATKSYLSNSKYIGNAFEQPATSFSHPTLAELNGLCKLCAVQDTLRQASTTKTGRQQHID
jgi:hypothetical protein